MINRIRVNFQTREFEGEMIIEKWLTCKCFDSNCTYISNFTPREIVSCGSETQLQVGKKKILYNSVL